MADRFVMCARSVKNGEFTNEPGPTQYLVVPEGERPSPRHVEATAVERAKKQKTQVSPTTQKTQNALERASKWLKKLLKAAVWGKDSRNSRLERGDILVFVHGYKNSPEDVMSRHDGLSEDLKKAGFLGAVVSFDWPSAAMALNYVEDRHDAKATAMQLVNDGIRVLSVKQTPDCMINIHLLGHSTGAYVIREAFDDADDAALDNNAWRVSQVALIAGDVSAGSLSSMNPSSDSLYRHCVRLTNYSNLHDSALKLSNTKRVFLSPRVGRVGLPEDSPSKAVNVDCSEYFELLESDPQAFKDEQTGEKGSFFSHSWYFGNKVLARDLFETLRGDLDRAVIPTRSVVGVNRLKLIRA